MKNKTALIIMFLFFLGFGASTAYSAQNSGDGSGIGGTGVKSGDGGIGGTGIAEQANEEMLPERVEMPERIERPELDFERPEFENPVMDSPTQGVEIPAPVERPE